MKYYIAFPQVAGELGARTVFSSRTPLRVSFLEYSFNMWPCDALLEAYPCFIVREDLSQMLEKGGLRGWSKSECAISFTDYVGRAPEIAPSHFHRFEPIGEVGIDDFAVSATQKLVISERAKKLLDEWLIDCEYQRAT